MMLYNILNLIMNISKASVGMYLAYEEYPPRVWNILRTVLYGHAESGWLRLNIDRNV